MEGECPRYNCFKPMKVEVVYFMGKKLEGEVQGASYKAEVLVCECGHNAGLIKKELQND